MQNKLKVLIIGSGGSMGKRYCAISKFFGFETIPVDVGDAIPVDFDRIIIATPTPNHLEQLRRYIPFNKPVLCEKPVSKELKECEEAVKLDVNKIVRVVCNWKFTPPVLHYNHSNRIFYNFYNTGKDGLKFDLCQLIYLSKGTCRINNLSPTFQCTINDQIVTLHDIERSYLTMFHHWVHCSHLMWNLEDGLRMTQHVLNYKV